MSNKSFTNYADYLDLPTLLSTQHPLTGEPDEMHFIVIHQIHELWFKLAIHELERARTAIQKEDINTAVRLINQVSGIFANARLTTEHLHELSPMAFHHFRQRLAPGSGMQSFQWREIEFLCAMPDSKQIDWVRRQLAKDDHWRHVLRRLDEPTIASVFESLLERRQIPDIATIYADTVRYSDLYSLCDALSILEQHVTRWRYSHIQLVERTIGAGVVGTGGTTHDYLQNTLQIRFFPALWEARNILTERVNEGEV